MRLIYRARQNERYCCKRCFVSKRVFASKQRILQKVKTNTGQNTTAPKQNTKYKTKQIIKYTEDNEKTNKTKKT